MKLGWTIHWKGDSGKDVEGLRLVVVSGGVP